MPVGERNGGIVKESSFSRVELMKKLSGDFFYFLGYFYLWGYVAPTNLGLHQWRDVCRLCIVRPLFFGGGNEKIFVILSHPQLHKSWLSSWWRSKFRTPRATPLSSTEFQAEAELDFKDWWGQSQNFVRGNYNLPSLDLALSQFSPQTSDCYIGPP